MNESLPVMTKECLKIIVALMDQRWFFYSLGVCSDIVTSLKLLLENDDDDWSTFLCEL